MQFPDLSRQAPRIFEARLRASDMTAAAWGTRSMLNQHPTHSPFCRNLAGLAMPIAQPFQRHNFGCDY